MGQEGLDGQAGDDAARFIVPLRRLVYIMAGVLVLLMVTVTSLIAWRIVHPRAGAAEGAAPREIIAGLPQGSRAGQISLDGNRLAVTVSTPDGDEVLVFDLGRGGLQTRIRLSH